MKILLINNFGRDYGGAELMVRQLKEELLKRGEDVRLLAGREPSPTEGFAEYKFRSFRDDSLSRYLLLIINPFALWSLYRVLREFKPDVVHAHTITKASPFLFLLLKKIPTVVTLHDHMLLDPTRPQDYPTLAPHIEQLSSFFVQDRKSPRYYGEKMRLFFSRRFYKNVDLAVACSHFYGRIIRDSKLFSRVVVIHNGIRPLPAHAHTSKNTILYFGRIEKSKGVDVLIEAMPFILNEVPDANLVIAGEGDARKELQDRAMALGLADSVRFEGYVKHEHAGQYMADAAVVVAPSVYPDNFPTVCLEAMFAARPLIASDIGGIPEMIVDGKTGELFTPGSHEELAAKAIGLLKNPSLRAKMGKLARARAEELFSVNAFIIKTLKAYSSVI